MIKDTAVLQTFSLFIPAVSQSNADELWIVWIPKIPLSFVVAIWQQKYGLAKQFCIMAEIPATGNSEESIIEETGNGPKTWNVRRITHLV